jgi:hypothetical protein
MSPDWRGVLTMTDLSPSDIERMQNPSASDIERRVETLSASDLETMEKLTAEMNAEVLQNKRLFEEKFPGSVEPTALQAPAVEYPIKSYSFSYYACFYLWLWCTVTYQTGEVRKFYGEGGGAGVGAGQYFWRRSSHQFRPLPQGHRGC